jgi:hypothetical protein
VTNPTDHDQLATLDEMTVSYDRAAGVFTFEREFDFGRSPSLSAAEVAETWELVFEREEFPLMEGSVSAEGERLTLTYRFEEVDTRHTLRHAVMSLSSELITLLATHDPGDAVDLAEHLLDNAERYEHRE